MNYFFIPGRLRDLSLAELKSVLRTFDIPLDGLNTKAVNYFTVEADVPEEKMLEIFNRLGGFIKFGSVIPTLSTPKDLVGDKSSITYGVSFYSFKKFSKNTHTAFDFAKTLKTGIEEIGVKARYVRARGNALSSGQIVGRKVLRKGFELCLLEGEEGKTILGKTIAVQDIEGFSERDYQRPDVDVEMGMLPPKLARIMINLAEVKPGGTIWDPFCGSGTVLIEALLLGYNVLGSDIDTKALEKSERNIKWISKQLGEHDLKFGLFQYDVKSQDGPVMTKLRNTEIDAVVFEPFMGPPQQKLLDVQTAEKQLSSIRYLYEGLGETCEHIKKYNLKVVGVIPSYKTTEGWRSQNLASFFSKRWEIINYKMNEKDLHWSRSNSIIKRILLIAELKK